MNKDFLAMIIIFWSFISVCFIFTGMVMLVISNKKHNKYLKDNYREEWEKLVRMNKFLTFKLNFFKLNYIDVFDEKLNIFYDKLKFWAKFYIYSFLVSFFGFLIIVFCAKYCV